MKIAVVGVGGVGGYFGGRLATQPSNEVFFVARPGRQHDGLKRHGLQVLSGATHGDFKIKPCLVVATAAEVGPVDVVLVCVKTYDLGNLTETLGPLLRDGSAEADATAVIPLLNGMDAPAALLKHLGEQHVLGGLCKIMAWIDSPGVIRHNGSLASLAFGELGARSGTITPRVERLLAAFAAAGVAADSPAHGIVNEMWRKMVMICTFSGTGAVRAPAANPRNARRPSRASLHSIPIRTPRHAKQKTPLCRHVSLGTSLLARAACSTASSNSTPRAPSAGDPRDPRRDS